MRQFSLGTLCLNCGHMQARHMYSCTEHKQLEYGMCWEGKSIYGFPECKCQLFRYSNLEYLESKYEEKLNK